MYDSKTETKLRRRLAKMKTPPLKLMRDLTLKSKSGMGHVNYDDEVKLRLYSDGTLWLTHCDAMLSFELADVKKLRKFFDGLLRYPQETR